MYLLKILIIFSFISKSVVVVKTCLFGDLICILLSLLLLGGFYLLFFCDGLILIKKKCSLSFPDSNFSLYYIPINICLLNN